MAISFSTISAVKMPVKTWQGVGRDMEPLSQSLTEKGALGDLPKGEG